MDTNIFLWLQSDPQRLGAYIELLEAETTERWISVVSTWEISIKYARGKLAIPEPPRTFIPRRIDAIAAKTLSIHQRHALGVSDLPPIHRDPFDRLLIAQAQLEHLTIVTSNAEIQRYRVETLAVA